MKVLVAAMSLPVEESTALIRNVTEEVTAEAGAIRRTGRAAGSC